MRPKYIIAIVVVAIAAVVAAIVLSSTPADQTKPTVTIEIRTQQRARVKVDGNFVGYAPRGLVVPFSSNPITIEVENARGGGTAKQTVVPDHNQMVDM